MATPAMSIDEAASFLVWFETSAKQAMGNQNEQGLKLLEQLMENSFATFRLANMVLYLECDRLVEELAASGENPKPLSMTALMRFMWMQFKASSLIEAVQIFAQGMHEMLAAAGQGAPVDPKLTEAFDSALAAATTKKGK